MGEEMTDQENTPVSQISVEGHISRNREEHVRLRERRKWAKESNAALQMNNMHC